MTLEAHVTGLSADQHPWIGRSVRLMTASTSLQSNRRVLEREWPSLVGMALVTSGLVRGCRAHHCGSRTDRAVGIVTVDARHCTFGNPVPIWPLELVGRAHVTPGALGIGFRTLLRNQTGRPFLVDRMAGY